MSALTYHPFDGSGPHNFYSSQPFGAWDRLLEWLAGDDADASDRFKLVEMFNRDEDCIEVVTEDGEPIGVLDENISRDDLLADYATIDEWELRQASDDAAREHMEDVRREELRNAAE